jgi:tRNA (mo5U34)-methyltransferase
MEALRTLQSHPSNTAPGLEDIHALGPWFHNLHLPDGRQTAPDHPLGDYPAYKWKQLSPHVPDDLSGMQVLDIGCNAGFFAIELARRGAHVTGIDHDPHYLRQASWAGRQFDLPGTLTFEQGDVYGLAGAAGRYDLVLFLGVFYHLRYPLLGLDLAAAASRDMLLVQSLATGGDTSGAPHYEDPGYLGRDLLREDAWPKLAFVEHELAGDPTNWWLPNPPAMHALLRSAGYTVQAMADDIHVCKRGQAAQAAEERLQIVLQSLGIHSLQQEEPSHVR